MNCVVRLWIHSNAADIIERNLTRRHPRSYCTAVLASIHAETHSDLVAEACSKVAERLTVLGGEVQTASKLASMLVKTGQCNIPFTSYTSSKLAGHPKRYATLENILEDSRIFFCINGVATCMPLYL